MPMRLLAALVATMGVAMPAQAATLLYTLQGMGADKWSASFQLDTAAAPRVTTTFNVTYNPLSVTYTRPGSGQQTAQAAVAFSTLIDQGGLRINLLSGAFPRSLFVFGDQLFSGTTATRGFLTGTFGLSDIPRTFTTDPIQVNYRLTVSDITAAVPEPATWALMLTGFALAGAALRRSRRAIPA